MPFRCLAPIAIALCTASFAALAETPNACEILSVAEINPIAGDSIQQVQQRRSGNPSECAFMDGRRAAVLVISVRQVQYAAENELQHERENLEKIYRSKVKYLTAVGENGFWLNANKQLVFRKGKTLVSVTFSRVANQNEIDTAQVARMIEARLK